MGNIAYGVKWYRTTKGQRQGAWGFADRDSLINLYWADVASDGSDDKRLSLHVNGNSYFQGGHRCGTTRATYNKVDGNGFDDDNDWELVFYHAN